jgi:hypothetical protein
VYVSFAAARKMDLRALSTAKFHVDIIEADERYVSLGPKLFWARYGPEGLKKEIGADFTLLPSLNLSTSSPSSPLYSPLKSRVRWSDDTSSSAPIFSSPESGSKLQELGTPNMVLPDQSVPSSHPLKESSNRFVEVASVPDISSINPAPSVIQQTFSKPKGRLLDLMVKNVSRDNLLTPDEIEVGRGKCCV